MAKKPSLLRQIVEIHYEQAKRRKALRTLAKVDWSLELLSEVVRIAAKEFQRGIEIAIDTKDPNGRVNTIRISSIKDAMDQVNTDDDIFNHLDDNVAVDRFITEHSRRR